MSATDTIVIRDLLVRGIIGLNDWEREKEQDIVINLELSLDARPAGRSDEMNDSINYRNLTKQIIEHVEAAAPFLVEALAHQIARIAIVDHGAVEVRVRVEKPGALRFARSVGVEVVRTAADFS
ncbi:MAG: dihydroneopterin aldolase [Gemmatimonadetes bacterium]|nr:dihydroneopterin aldolase [Gemmatimonadota bacterium]